MTREEELVYHLWDFFKYTQYDILDGKDFAQFIAFDEGKEPLPPFVEGSAAWRVCVLCGKLEA